MCWNILQRRVQKRIKAVVVKEAKALTDKYGRPRRTEIADASISDVASEEELIPDEKGLVIFSDGGHIKRVCDTTFATQVRPSNARLSHLLARATLPHSLLPAQAMHNCCGA